MLAAYPALDLRRFRATELIAHGQNTKFET
jgi:hypothetical protein